MRALIQRVKQAKVAVGDEIAGEIGPGLLVLLGIRDSDTEADVDYLVDKVINLRIFTNEEGRFDTSVKEVGGSVLVVSQFTLYGSCKKGRRPDFASAAPPDLAEELYKKFVQGVEAAQIPVQTGVFRAMMNVELINDGPVTIQIESPPNQ